MESCGGDSHGAVLVKEVLLPCGLDCYLVYWSGHRQGPLGLTRLLFIRAAEHQIVAYRTMASEPSGWVYLVLFSCGEWCCRMKDKFSLIEIWYICGTLLRGVGMFKLLLLLSITFIFLCDFYFKGII